MSGEVTFEGEDNLNNTVGNIQIVPGAPTGMLAWLLKNKVVKNGKQAEQILLWIAGGAVILAVIIYGLNFWHLPNPNASKPVGAPIPTTVTSSP